jgi:hypothetical protein
MKLSNRDRIVREALDEIHPADDKKTACEKEVRAYLGLLDSVVEASDVPNPADFRDQTAEVATALRKIETIVSAFPHVWANMFRVGAGVDANGKALMMPPVDYDRFMADVARLIQKADFQSERLDTTREGTRGAQGNAFKTILAMGYVLDREREDEDGINAEAAGITIIKTRGVEHRIEFRVDHVTNEPKITHTTKPSSINVGTSVTIKWPMMWGHDEFIQLAESYVWFNPHLTLRGTWLDKEFINVAATKPTWKKWEPRNPTSSHWYDSTRLQRYLAAHVARDRDIGRHRTVREFISEFRGLSGTAVQRKVLEEVGCSHQSLAQFFGVDRVNREGIDKLLASMCKHTKPVAAKHLGIIGTDHLKQRFLAAGGNADTFKYQQRKGVTSEGIPYIVEFAFGLHQSGLTPGAAVSRKFITGANWSVGINNPFRAFGSTGEGLESTLAKVRANASSPVICALHLASAYVQYADRGKSSIILTDDAEQPDD